MSTHDPYDASFALKRPSVLRVHVLDLFNHRASARLKREGMQRAANKRRENLEMARDYARLCARKYGTVHADIVGRWTVRRGIDLGPAAGSLFKGKEWEWTGEWVKSSRTTNHGRMLRLWRLNA